jgi:hypothetical protein
LSKPPALPGRLPEFDFLFYDNIEAKMTPKERFMKVLNLEEPDQIPFADWVDKEIRQKLVEAMGADQMDEGQFGEAIGFDFFFLYDDIAYKKGPMFNPTLLREFFLPRFKLLADKISIPWAYHSDGDLSTIFDDLLGLGMNCINPLNHHQWILKRSRSNMVTGWRCGAILILSIHSHMAQ